MTDLKHPHNPTIIYELDFATEDGHFRGYGINYIEAIENAKGVRIDDAPLWKRDLVLKALEHWHGGHAKPKGYAELTDAEMAIEMMMNELGVPCEFNSRRFIEIEEV